MTQGGPDAYLAEQIRSTLASDGRVSDLGLHVTIAGDVAFVTGMVATPARRDAVTIVITERFPGLAVRNDVVVQEVGRRPSRETLS